MLVLLPPAPGLDIVLFVNSFPESSGFLSKSAMGGEMGARGNGFSRLLLIDLSLVVCAGAEYVELDRISMEVCDVEGRSSSGTSWIAVARWAWVVEVSISPGRFLAGCETDPRRRMPLFTPLKKSPFSCVGVVIASSSLFVGSWFVVKVDENAEENFDSNEALGRKVSLLSAMITSYRLNCSLQHKHILQANKRGVKDTERQVIKGI